MKKYGIAILMAICILACEDEIRNIAPVPPPIENNGVDGNGGPTPVNPQDITVDGFDLLEKMQGHWIGINRVIATDYPWFAFDYRAISPSHVHGIFEGGTGGNLLTSFFVTDYKNTRTIMARNGGLLNGIYRSSYFVLDSVSNNSNGKYFRLVDALGGTGVMYMELRFLQDSLYFNAYTSRLGQNQMPTRHMTFKAIKQNTHLAQAAAMDVGFPQNISAWDFSVGFNRDSLYVNPGDTGAKSASFLWQAGSNTDVFTLSKLAGDPFKIGDHPYLGYLQVDAVRNAQIQDKTLFVYLSNDSLTDAFGFLKANALNNNVLVFPEIISSENQFTFTYLHPGDYYVTVIADANDDGFVSAGDITHVSQFINISPLEFDSIRIDNINVQN